MRKQKGFTLIELLVGVAIVGILTVVVVPTYQSYVLQTKRTDGKMALTDMADRQERYYSQNNTYASDVATLFGEAGDQFSSRELYILTVTAGNTNTYSLTATAEADMSGDTGCTILTYSQAGAKTPVECWE